MGVGEQGPQDFEIWHFPINCFVKKVVFLVSSDKNEILPLLAPWKYICGQPLDITVGAGKFLGVQMIFARSSPNLPEKFVRDFYWIFKDFAHISTNQNIWGALFPCTPTYYTTALYEKWLIFGDNGEERLRSQITIGKMMTGEGKRLGFPLKVCIKQYWSTYSCIHFLTKGQKVVGRSYVYKCQSWKHFTRELRKPLIIATATGDLGAGSGVLLTLGV